MKTIITLILISVSVSAFAQDSLLYHNYDRYRTTSTGMNVLGYWGVANTAVGAIGWSASKGGSNYFFYKMTTIYGVANMGASLLGNYTALRSMKQHLDGPQSLKAQRKIETTFLVNGCIDVASIGLGIYLKSHVDSHNSASQRGYGSALIVQNAFLLLFDGTMYTAQKYNGKKLRRFLEKNPITFDGKSIGLIYNM